MSATGVDGLIVSDLLVTPEPDVDGFFGVGLMLRDKAGDYHGIYFWVGGDVRFFLEELVLDVEYEIRDEVLDIAVPLADGLGVERLKQTCEFIRPRGIGPFVPIVKRVEFGARAPEDFKQRAIPARTP